MEKIDIITIAKDENSILNEWIEHYINLNINHIYIFDDNSEVKFKDIIVKNEKILNKITIFTIENDFYTSDFELSLYYDDTYYNKQNISKQMYFINYFIKKIYNISDNWLLHCDMDEFLILKNNNFFIDIINNYKECNKIFIPWIIYGTSYLVDYDKNNTLNETFKMHNNKYDHLYKCIFKPIQAKNRLANNPHFININPSDKIYIIGYDKIFTVNDLKKIYKGFYHFKYNIWVNFKNDSLIAHFNHYQFLSVKDFIKRKIFRTRCAESLWKKSNRNLWLQNNKCVRYLHDYKFNESGNDNNNYLPILNYNVNKNTLYEMMDYKNINEMTVEKYKDILDSNDLRYWTYYDLEQFLKKNNFYNNNWDNILKSKNKVNILYNLYYLINKEYIN